MSNDTFGGPWKPEMYLEHLPEPIAFDQGLINSALELCNPVKCLDVGCGLGYFVQFLREHQVDAWGVEPNDLRDVFKANGYLIQRDLSSNFDLEEKYDLVICLEVVEHIPHEFEDIVFDNIRRHMSKYLLFSGATPGQGGTGHINEQAESHWFSHLVGRDLKLCHEKSIKVRSASSLWWYAKNVSIWEVVEESNLVSYSNIIAEKSSHALSSDLLLIQTRAERDASTANQNYIQTQLQQTQLELSQAHSQTQQTQSELSQAHSQIQQAQSELSQAHLQIHQTQLELSQAHSQIHQTQSELSQAHSQIHQTQSELSQAHSQIHQIQSELFQAHSQIQQTQSELFQADLQAQQIKSELEDSQGRIVAMESSKFWQMRIAWFQFKKILKLPE